MASTQRLTVGAPNCLVVEAREGVGCGGCATGCQPDVAADMAPLDYGQVAAQGKGGRGEYPGSVRLRRFIPATVKVARLVEKKGCRRRTACAGHVLRALRAMHNDFFYRVRSSTRTPSASVLRARKGHRSIDWSGAA